MTEPAISNTCAPVAAAASGRRASVFYPPLWVIAVVLVALALVGAASLWLLNLTAPGIMTDAIAGAMADPARAPLILKAGMLDTLAIGWALPQPLVVLSGMLLTISALVSVFGGLFALTSLVERKILARIQNRLGPNRVGPCGLFQPIADGIKMLTKEDIVPHAADRAVHFLAPIVIVIPALLVLAVLPYGPGMTPIELGVGILFFFALGAITEVGVFMAGWGSNNKYSLLGAMRAIAQMISYEVPLILAAVAVVMIAGSLSPTVIVEQQAGWAFGVIPQWFIFTPWGFVGFILFFTAALAESNRSPFDLPEGESELVAGHLTEYSGFKYACFFLAEYIGLFGICGLAVALFLGGWHAPLPFLEFIPPYVWFMLKLIALVLLAIWIRGTVPRIRGDQLMSLAWKVMIPYSFVVIFAAGVWHLIANPAMALAITTVIVLIPYAILTYHFKRRLTAQRRTYRYSTR